MKSVLLSLVLLGVALNARLITDFSAYPDTTVAYATPHVTINDLSPQEAEIATRVTAFEDQKVNSGYVKISDKASMFFVFYESLDANADAPVILWLQGGPGGSSMFGNYCEMGPHVLIQDDEGFHLEKREINWNDKYHLMFIDNPVGVGYSYVTDKSAYRTDEDGVAADLHTGLLGFFNAFPQYKPNDFHIFGESYAGKYIPAISKLILEKNEAGVADEHIGLTSIGIGDGATNPKLQFTLYGDYAYANGLIDGATLHQVYGLENQFVSMVEQENWTEANNYWNQVLEVIVEAAGGFNEYNFRQFQEPGCADFTKYLNQKDIKTQFHIPDFVTFNSTSGSAGGALTNDIPKDISDRVAYVVERLPVLLYNGQNDFIVNTPGADAWIKALEWSHQDEFNATPRAAWKSQSTHEPAGYFRNVANLYQAVIINSGHMVPLDQPESAKEMLDGYLAMISKKQHTEAY